MKKMIFALAFILSGTAGAAGDCSIMIKREACPGKEKIAFKPYDGKEETDEISAAKDETECKKDAEKLVKIIRKGTLAKKTATISFKGKSLGNASEKADCK